MREAFFEFPVVPKGTSVRIPRGTLLRSTRKGLGHPYASKRQQTIVSFGLSGKHEQDIVWTGSGGYWVHARKWDVSVQDDQGAWQPLLDAASPQIKDFVSQVTGAWWRWYDPEAQEAHAVLFLHHQDQHLGGLTEAGVWRSVPMAALGRLIRMQPHDPSAPLRCAACEGFVDIHGTPLPAEAAQAALRVLGPAKACRTGDCCR